LEQGIYEKDVLRFFYPFFDFLLVYSDFAHQ